MALVACDEDTRPRTLIDNLRVVSIAAVSDEWNADTDDDGAEQAELLPGDDLTIRTLIADPRKPGSDLEYLVIACTAFSGVSGCLEEIQLVDMDDVDSGELDLDENDYQNYFAWFVRHGHVSSSEMGTFIEDGFQVPRNLDALSDLGYDTLSASVTVLVCHEGVCPIMDTVDAFKAESPDAPSGEEMLSIISQPDRLLSGLPVNDVTMGKKSYRVTLTEAATGNWSPNHNPMVLSVEPVECDSALSSSSTGRRCGVKVTVNERAQELYYSTSTSSTSTQEAILIRFYSTAGAMDSYYTQLYSTTPREYTMGFTLPDEGEVPDQIGFFAAVVDSRDGMAGGFHILDTR